jgi:CelD/BcsL family acetyltransferase involved in cellulose biosynthesis
MQLKVITAWEDTLPIATAWNTLLNHSASDVPFLRQDYLGAWWSGLGGGEWQQGDLYVVAGFKDNQLAAVAPLFLTTHPAGEKTLLFIGSHEISDYLDFIARPQDLPAFLDALGDYLASPQAPAWQVLDCYNLLNDSPSRAALVEMAQSRNWRWTDDCLQPSPTIPLAGDYESYLLGLDKKQRHEVRRKARRAASYHQPVEWHLAGKEHDLAEEMDAFFTLMANDPHKTRFLTAAMRAQMGAIAQAAAGSGLLQLAFITVGGQKAAGYLNFDYNQCLWVYNSGLDFSFSELSLGNVLLGYLIEWAIERGYKQVDMMRGGEEYKYRLGGVERYVHRVRVSR